jgi:hypothetical protein
MGIELDLPCWRTGNCLVLGPFAFYFDVYPDFDVVCYWIKWDNNITDHYQTFVILYYELRIIDYENPQT